MPGVILVRADLCQYGLEMQDSQGTAPVKKPTGFLTNSALVAGELGRVCDNTHRHVVLEGRRCKRAQVYPRQLCDAICRGAAREREHRKRGLYTIGTVEEEASQESFYGDEHEEDGEGDWTIGDGAAHGEAGGGFFDNVTGKPLDRDGVMKARQ